MSFEYSPLSDYLKNKAAVDKYASGEKRLGDSFDMDFKPTTPEAPTLGVSEAPGMAQTAAQTGTAAATGFAMGGPAGAAIAAGGTLLTNYLAQKAADERQRRQNAASIEQTYGQNQTNAYNSILANLGRALR